MGLTALLQYFGIHSLNETTPAVQICPKASLRVHKKGSKRKLEDGQCEKSWLAKRRTSVSQAVATSTVKMEEGITRSTLALELWTDKQRREVQAGVTGVVRFLCDILKMNLFSIHAMFYEIPVSQ